MKVCIFAVCFGALAFACGTDSDYELYDGSDQASYAAKGGGGGGGGKPPKDGGGSDPWNDFAGQCCDSPATSCQNYCDCAAGLFITFLNCAHCNGDPTCENQCYFESDHWSCVSSCGSAGSSAPYCQ